MSGGITKLRLALILLFVFSALGLSAEVVYVLYYRRRPRRATSADDPELPSRADGRRAGPSKELFLFLLCWQNQSRVEPDSTSAAKSPVSPATAATQAKTDAVDSAEDGDLSRWRTVLFGPSRMLFTIREEEREGTESDAGAGDEGNSVGEVEEEEDEMPFSTPCASPAFYTPASSPARSVEVVAAVSGISGAGPFSPAEDRV